MDDGIDQEVPDAEATLIPVCRDLVWILKLIRNYLMQLTAFELHLLLVKLILNYVRPSLAWVLVLISLLLVIEVVRRNALPEIVALVALEEVLRFRIINRCVVVHWVLSSVVIHFNLVVHFSKSCFFFIGSITTFYNLFLFLFWFFSTFENVAIISIVESKPWSYIWVLMH